VKNRLDFADARWMRLAKRERPDWLRQLGMALLVGVLLGVFGPFRSSATMSVGARYAFWVASALAGLLCLWGADALLGDKTRRSAWLRAAALAAASAVPMTFFVAWLFSLVQPGRVFPPGRLLALYFAVALVQLILAAAVRRGTAVPEPSQPPRTSRLPRELGDDVIALEAEDHYLRVHRSSGSTLVLMRLADAVAADDGHQGLQVHRSWWVSRDAVERMEGARLHLSNGLNVPVGRTFAAQVRAAFRS
jgi:hypothetical protein